jgi:hypothetical protein
MTVETDVPTANVKSLAAREVLWAELVRQWWANHCQRCGSVWPHDDPSECWCKPPAVLDSVTADDLTNAGLERFGSGDDPFD